MLNEMYRDTMDETSNFFNVSHPHTVDQTKWLLTPPSPLCFLLETENQYRTEGDLDHRQCLSPRIPTAPTASKFIDWYHDTRSFPIAGRRCPVETEAERSSIGKGLLAPASKVLHRTNLWVTSILICSFFIVNSRLKSTILPSNNSCVSV